MTVEMFAKCLPALAFQPTSPAKLSGYGPVTAQLDTTGAAGTVRLYVQHYNDRLAAWCDLTDIPGLATLVGELVHNTPLALPEVVVGPGEQLLFWVSFQATADTDQPPSLLSLSWPWSSDVAAPAAPTISAITSVAPTGGQVGYRVDFGALPAGARHFVVEGQLNGGAWLPFSKKATWVAGTSYMEFRGALDEIEAAGERNERHLSSTGFTLGDVVSVRVAAEDGSGNRSAFTVSDALTIAGATYIAVPASTIRLSLRSSRLTLRLR